MNSNNANAAVAAQQVKKPKEKRVYTFKQKLLPSILLSLAIPLTVCLFGPFDIYLGNMAEFRYSLTDFLPLCAAGGSVLLLAADIPARSLSSGAELPLSIFTVIIAAPTLAYILCRRARDNGYDNRL